MKRETLTSVLYYTLIAVGLFTTFALILHMDLEDGFWLVNSILELPFFTVDPSTTEFHKVVLSIVTVASWVVYAVALTTCFMFPYSWDIIYDSLYFLYKERNVVEISETPETKIRYTTPAQGCDDKGSGTSKYMYTLSPTVVQESTRISLNTDDSYYKSTITDLPHVARVISGTEGRTVYVYNVVTGEYERMSECEFYENQKRLGENI